MRRCSLKYDRGLNEYSVVVYNEKNHRIEKECYYTDDKQDAIDTMKDMERRYREKEEKAKKKKQ